jgi:hypothetical protein
MIGFDSKAGCALDDDRVIGRRKFQRDEHFDIVDSRLGGEAGSERGHFDQPMHGLQDLQSPSYDRLNQDCATGRIYWHKRGARGSEGISDPQSFNNFLILSIVSMGSTKSRSDFGRRARVVR